MPASTVNSLTSDQLGGLTGDQVTTLFRSAYTSDFSARVVSTMSLSLGSSSEDKLTSDSSTTSQVSLKSRSEKTQEACSKLIATIVFLIFLFN